MATKADIRRAIVRTAALAHWRHHFTAAAHPANDDGVPAICCAAKINPITFEHDREVTYV